MPSTQKPKAAARTRPDNLLICGPSGSGKTYAAKAIAAHRKKPIVLLNCGSAEEYLDSHVDVTPGDWDEIPLDKEELTYIIEDIANLTQKQKDTVTRLTCHTSRHQASTVILITYQINCTGISSFISYLTTVLFTADKVNSRSLAQVLKHFCYPDPEGVLASFDALPPRAYLKLEPQALLSGTLDLSSSLPRPPQGSGGERGPGFEVDRCMMYFKHRPDHEECRLLLTFLGDNLPANTVRERDWSVKGIDEEGADMRISLLDYVEAVRDAAANPSAEVTALHGFIISQCCLPALLVKNKRLRKMRPTKE